MVKHRIKNTSVELFQGNIVTLEVDAIVNAANSTLLGGGGVDGAIHRAAGPDLLKECKTLGGCKTGEAKITKGYLLPAKYVIHTVGPVFSGTPKDEQLLSAAIKNSLSLADQHSLKSIAFPAISTGAYGYPINEAANVILRTITDYIKKETTSLERIIVCLFDNPAHEVFKNVLSLLVN